MGVLICKKCGQAWFTGADHVCVPSDYERGRTEECGAIVAYLRRAGGAGETLAEDIELGEHMPEVKP